MKNLNNLFIHLVLFSFFSITTYAQEKISLSTKKVDGKYQIDVPSILEEMNELNELASLSYGNGEEELYMIVIDFDKDDLGDIANLGVDEFYQLLVDDLSGSIQDTKVEDPAEIRSENMEVRRGIVTRVFNENLDIYYYMNVVETEKTVYQMAIWTLEENATKYRPTMDKVFDSFKEF